MKIIRILSLIEMSALIAGTFHGNERAANLARFLIFAWAIVVVPMSLIVSAVALWMSTTGAKELADLQSSARLTGKKFRWFWRGINPTEAVIAAYFGWFFTATMLLVQFLAETGMRHFILSLKLEEKKKCDHDMPKGGCGVCDAAGANFGLYTKN